MGKVPEEVWRDVRKGEKKGKQVGGGEIAFLAALCALLLLILWHYELPGLCCDEAEKTAPRAVN